MLLFHFFYIYITKVLFSFLKQQKRQTTVEETGYKPTLTGVVVDRLLSLFYQFSSFVLGSKGQLSSLSKLMQHPVK